MFNLNGLSKRKVGTLFAGGALLAVAAFGVYFFDLWHFQDRTLTEVSIVDTLMEQVKSGEDASGNASGGDGETAALGTPEEGEEEVSLSAIDPDGRLAEALKDIKALRAGSKEEKPAEQEEQPSDEEEIRSAVSRAQPEGERGARLFTENTGLLFVYRLRWDGIASRKIPVFLDEKALVQLDHGRFLALPCSLATHELSSEIERQRVSVSVDHGETYCVNVYTGMLGKGGVKLVSLEECRQQLEGLAPQFAQGVIPVLFE